MPTVPGHFQPRPPFHVNPTFPPPPPPAHVIEAQWLDGFKHKFLTHQSPAESAISDAHEPPLRYVLISAAHSPS